MKPARSINRKMIEAALLLKQFNGDVVQTVPYDVDLKHTYCVDFDSNVIDGITVEMFCCDFIQGDGAELLSQIGSAPKFNSISSSAALAVNTFAPWKERIGELIIKLNNDKFSGFEYLEFEHITPTEIPNARRHPNLDVWLEADNAVLAIECKFCEYLGDRSDAKPLHSAYKRLASRKGQHNPWVRAINHVTNRQGECKYEYFDAVQIIRHYFGVLNSGFDEKHLLYLYWHPENNDWAEISPFGSHLEELREFAELVSQATDVRFHYMSFNDLWAQWKQMDLPHVSKHVDALEQRYLVEIETKNIGEKHDIH
jgi:hypothetical protein